MAEKNCAEIKIPRITSKQKNRSNYETDSAIDDSEHYYRHFYPVLRFTNIISFTTIFEYK